jgi:putative spermidine/putrescine transport system ATP-binding protein
MTEGTVDRVDAQLVAVTKRFGETTAVDDVSLDVERGEFFSLLGPSGSGKTTCLRMIAGFEAPTSGHVRLGGRDVTNVAPYDRDVNTVFQDYALFPHMTVAQNVEYGLRVKRVGKAERRTRAGEALELVRLDGYADRRPGQLSGGQRQRVALARALVNRPRVLLLDEPLGALDLKLREEMQGELKRIQTEVGITFIYVTHDQDEALAMSDRIAVFSAGRIEQIGTPAEIYELPVNGFVAGFVGTSNVVTGAAAQAIRRQPASFTVRPEKIQLFAGDVPLGTDVRARGTVRDVVYLGDRTRFVVDLDAGATLVVVEQNSQALSADVMQLRGATVHLAWEPRFEQELESDAPSVTDSDNASDDRGEQPTEQSMNSPA